MNDTQVAVPLALQTAHWVTSLYDLMDAGYVDGQIRAQSMQLGHVPLIPPQILTLDRFAGGGELTGRLKTPRRCPTLRRGKPAQERCGLANP